MNVQESYDATAPSVAATQGVPESVVEEERKEATSLLRKVMLAIAPIVGLATFFLTWQIGARAFDVKEYILPRPSVVLDNIIHAKRFYWDNARITIWEAFVGFVLAFVLAMIVATAMAHSRFIERAVMPLAVLVQVTPIIAYASAIVIWQGFGFRSIVVVTIVVCFVPFLMNAVSGLRSVDPSLIELARSVNASRREIFVRLRLPSALPSLFSAARIAVGLALIGAVLGEFFGGSLGGLGYVIKRSLNSLPAHILLFGSVFVLGFIGAAATFFVTVAERYVLHWHSSQRE